MPKKKINSRSKGIRGEHQVRDLLRSLGFGKEATYRTAQRKGTGTNDITCEELPNLHIEAKLWGKYSALGLNAAIHQALHDALGKPSCVIWRCTHSTPSHNQWHISYVMGSAIVTCRDKIRFRGLLVRLNNAQTE